MIDAPVIVIAEALLNGLWRGLAVALAMGLLLRATRSRTTAAERYGAWLATLVVVVVAPFAELAVSPPVESAAAPPHVARAVEADFSMAPLGAGEQASFDVEAAPWLGPLLLAAWPFGALGGLIVLALRVRAAIALEALFTRRGRRLAWGAGPVAVLTSARPDRGDPRRRGRNAAHDRLGPAGRLASGSERAIAGYCRERTASGCTSKRTSAGTTIGRSCLPPSSPPCSGFNPAVHWIKARLDAEREAACDEAVLGAGVAPEEYAQALTSLAESLAVPTAATLGAASSKRSIVQENRDADVRFSGAAAVRPRAPPSPQPSSSAGRSCCGRPRDRAW